MGLLTTTDRAVVELYCETYSLYRVAHEKVKKLGDLYTSPNKKYVQVAPWYTARNRYLEDCRKMLVEFGLPPAARVRMRVEVKDKTSNK